MAKTYIHGAKEIEAVLKELPEQVGRNVLNGALMSGANVVVKEARARAPRGKGDTKDAKGRNVGHLFQNIRRKRWKRGSHSAEVKIGIGAAFWGMFLEFGTSKMAARPWLRPAWDASKEKALAAIGKSLGRGLERAATKLAGKYSKSGLGSRRGIISRAARAIGR